MIKKSQGEAFVLEGNIGLLIYIYKYQYMYRMYALACFLQSFVRLFDDGDDGDGDDGDDDDSKVN